ncbi:hypothetical protein C8J57DRAFT_1541138 [Mycena rebaudengoi]|nr:hypothetical protein C8J57DRAFT_1541138 [Mycena rebaudengoi]
MPFEEDEGSHPIDSELPFRHGPDSRRDYDPPIATVSDAMEKIAAWALQTGIMELNSLHSIPDEFSFNPDWLCKSVLVLDDSRSLTRMKVFANCAEQVQSVEEVLKLALRFGIPFDLFVKAKDTPSFGHTAISYLDRIALPSVYNAGFVEPSLEYAKGGAVLYGQYMNDLKDLMTRPNAVAFIAMGGMASWIAQLYNDSRAVTWKDPRLNSQSSAEDKCSRTPKYQ